MTTMDKITELKNFVLLQGFSDSELKSLAESMDERSFKAGEFVFHEQDASTEVYFIINGRIEICRNVPGKTELQQVAVLTEGSEVGEMALVDGSPRSASARALVETSVFVMDIHRLPITLILLSRLISNIALSGTRRLRRQEPEQPVEIEYDGERVKELRQFDLFQGLTSHELQTLANSLESRRLSGGECLFRENENSSEVYFIRNGKFEVRKSDSSGNDQVLTTLSAGQEVGEMALLDGSPRSASVYATEQSDVFVLQTSRLPNNLMMLSRFIRNITLSGADKLRHTNVEHVHSLERELASVRLRNEFGQFFIYILSVFSLGTIINYLLHTYLKSLNVYGELFKWGYLFVLLIPSIAVIMKMKVPFSDLGVTLKNWKKSLLEGGLVSLVIGVAFYGAVGILRHNQILPEKPFQFYLPGLIPYVIHSFLQELLARGVLQSSFERFFEDRRGIRAVLLTAGLFGLFHIHFGLIAVVITMISGVFFGAFYLRHHNLIGVSILHAMLGIYAFSSGIL